MDISRVFLHRLCLILVLAFSAGVAHAQIVDPQNVLIQNVNLADGGKDAEAVLVNILIANNKLEIVSKDPIPADNAVVIVDARNGYLLGNLEIGQTPSFIILSEDPRADVEVLLDTKSYTIFAVHDGRLLRNSLYGLSEEARLKEIVASKWRAYTPPPMALPLSYLDETKWNRWETKPVSGIFIAGLLLDHLRWTSQDSESEQQVGDLELFNGGEIRGLRVGAVGTLNFKKPWVYTVFGATSVFDKGFEVKNLDSFVFLDYRLDIPLFEKMSLSVGQQKEPFSMERVMSMLHLPMQERTAVSDAMLPSRNFGVVLSGTVLDQRITWAGGAFNDWINTPGSISENATEVMGRVTWLPYISSDESNLIHLGFGARFSNATDGLRYATEPEFNKSPIFVDTEDDLMAADNSRQYSVEAAWRNGPYMLMGEYLRTDIDAPALSDPIFNGYHISGSWILSGEMHDYRRKSGIFHAIPVAKTVNQGGWGAWELGFRISSLDLTDGLVDGGEMDILSLGINWWLTPVFNVNLNYRYVTLDRFGVEGSSSGILTRVVILME